MIRQMDTDPSKSFAQTFFMHPQTPATPVLMPPTPVPTPLPAPVPAPVPIPVPAPTPTPAILTTATTAAPTPVPVQTISPPILKEGNVVRIRPNVASCSLSPLLVSIVYSVPAERNTERDVTESHWLNILSADVCIPMTTQSGDSLGYWLLRRLDGQWEMRPSLVNDVTRVFGGPEDVIPVIAIEKVDIASDFSNMSTVAKLGIEGWQRRQRMGGIISWGDDDLIGPDLRLVRTRDPRTGRRKTRVRLSNGEHIYLDAENIARIKLQSEIMAKKKPPLERVIAGGQFGGLGIRNVPESELRREWLDLAVNNRIAIQIKITKPNGDFITTTIVKGTITEKWTRSPLMNGMGVVYIVSPQSVVGDKTDVFAFTPIKVGHRSLRYWLCVYDDLLDTKVMITSATIGHERFVKNTKSGENSFKLAEYAVEDVRQIDQNDVVIPFDTETETTPQTAEPASPERHIKSAISHPQSTPKPDLADKEQTESRDDETDENNEDKDADGKDDTSEESQNDEERQNNDDIVESPARTPRRGRPPAREPKTIRKVIARKRQPRARKISMTKRAIMAS